MLLLLLYQLDFVTPGIIPRSAKVLKQILHSLKSPYYPKLLFHKVYSQNPITEERLKKRLFVTIEERLDAKPLSDVRNRFIDEKSVLGLLEKLVIALS